MIKTCVPSRGEWALPIYWEDDENGPGVTAWAWNVAQHEYYFKRLGSNAAWARSPMGPQKAFYSDEQEWLQYALGCPPVPRVKTWKFPRPSCDIKTSGEDTMADSSISVTFDTDQIQKALAPVARDIDALRSRLDQSQGYIEWLEGEVDDLASGSRSISTIGHDEAKQIAEVARVADKRSWAHVFRSFVMTSIMVGTLVGGCAGAAMGAASGVSCAMSLMAILQLMRAMTYRDEAKRADDVLGDHGAVRLSDCVALRRQV